MNKQVLKLTFAIVLVLGILGWIGYKLWKRVSPPIEVTTVELNLTVRISNTLPPAESASVRFVLLQDGNELADCSWNSAAPTEPSFRKKVSSQATLLVRAERDPAAGRFRIEPESRTVSSGNQEVAFTLVLDEPPPPVTATVRANATRAGQPLPGVTITIQPPTLGPGGTTGSNGWATLMVSGQAGTTFTVRAQSGTETLDGLEHSLGGETQITETFSFPEGPPPPPVTRDYEIQVRQGGQPVSGATVAVAPSAGGPSRTTDAGGQATISVTLGRGQPVTFTAQREGAADTSPRYQHGVDNPNPVTLNLRLPKTYTFIAQRKAEGQSPSPLRDVAIALSGPDGLHLQRRTNDSGEIRVAVKTTPGVSLNWQVQTATLPSDLQSCSATATSGTIEHGTSPTQINLLWTCPHPQQTFSVEYRFHASMTQPDGSQLPLPNVPIKLTAPEGAPMPKSTDSNGDCTIVISAIDGATLSWAATPSSLDPSCTEREKTGSFAHHANPAPIGIDWVCGKDTSAEVDKKAEAIIRGGWNVLFGISKVAPGNRESARKRPEITGRIKTMKSGADSIRPLIPAAQDDWSKAKAYLALVMLEAASGTPAKTDDAADRYQQMLLSTEVRKACDPTFLQYRAAARIVKARFEDRDYSAAESLLTRAAQTASLQEDPQIPIAAFFARENARSENGLGVMLAYTKAVAFGGDPDGDCAEARSKAATWLRDCKQGGGRNSTACRDNLFIDVLNTWLVEYACPQ